MPRDILNDILERKRRELAELVATVPERLLRERAEARVDRRPFRDALARPGAHGVNIVAEIKRASPSKGAIRPDLDPIEYAQAYERGGAAALSVLTDHHYFLGSPEDLLQARAATSLPVLRKDFIISTYQVYESAAMGADAVLLIARALSPDLLRECLGLSRELRLAPLVEVHSPEDLDRASAAGATLIGINNRDLSSFETDLSLAGQMARRLAPDQIAVAESGIRTRADVEALLEAGIRNFLVGESLVRAPEPEVLLRHLLGCPDDGG
jgi:indole-3-glycerol phosphate synthase